LKDGDSFYVHNSSIPIFLAQGVTSFSEEHIRSSFKFELKIKTSGNKCYVEEDRFTIPVIVKNKEMEVDFNKLFI